MKAPAIAAAFALAALPACEALPDPAVGRSIQSLTFETGPCFGACPVYRVTVNVDGTGTFEGRRFTAVTGLRSFRVTPQQFRAFERHLAPLRPLEGIVRYAGEACASMATDMPSAEVTWLRLGEAEQQLYFYYGCDMERNRGIAERLSAAPGLLPIGDYIAARR
ncbi:MAG TPA: DUF6438 domain-containing protein [Allosphingosinicella sp.]|nr:DUF6438 domain-containing protein [Allosphingosinicella sp.]